jgi:hypothetical protein
MTHLYIKRSQTDLAALAGERAKMESSGGLAANFAHLVHLKNE